MTVQQAPSSGKGRTDEGTRRASAGPPSDRQIARWLRLFVEDGQFIELRAVKYLGPGRKRPETVVERFRAEDLAEVSGEALRLSGRAKGVYFTLNPVRPDLDPEKAATDADIVTRRWLLIDCDPKRKGEVSSTDGEKAAAVALAAAVRSFLAGRGFPDPIEADSGNGAHLLYRIELPADDGGLVRDVLNALADRFDTAAVGIDRKVFNPSRICKLYGTEARKGEPTPDRPHRSSRVVTVPAELVPVAPELLRALVADGRPAEKPPAPAKRPTPPRGARKGANVLERARKYLESCARKTPAIQGQDGSGQTFKVACAVGPGFDLDPETAFRLIRDVYNPSCVPPWSDAEIRHKLDGAYKDPGNPPFGWLRDAPSNGNGHAATAPPGSQPPARTRAGAGDRRPAIILDTDEHRVIDQAVAALSSEPDVFERGNALVRILRDPSRARREKIRRPVGSPRIAPLPRATLRELLTRAAAWSKYREDRNGEVKVIPAHPTDWAVNGVEARGEWPGVRHLEAIIESPALRSDGTVLDAPGWDDETELYFEPNADFPPVPRNPSRDDAGFQAEILLRLVVDFPFAGEEHKGAWLAALLTPLARFAISGPCPLFLFNSNSPGTGKSKLTDMIAIIATGREMPRTAYPDADEGEMRKRITATALAGDRLMLIDNIAATFGGSALDSMITARTWKDRELGASRMTPDLPLHTVWYGTGNNVELKGDIRRRVLPCRLATKEERPEERTGFAIEGELLGHVRANRNHLVAAALTILRAHALAGRPRGDLTPFGSFEAWSDVVRSAVYWATGLDPCKTREELRASDREAISRAALIEGWAELPGAMEMGLTVAEALRLLREDAGGRYTKLHDCLMERSRKSGELPSPEAIGKLLGANRGRVCEGRCIDADQSIKRALVWKVVKP